MTPISLHSLAPVMRDVRHAVENSKPFYDMLSDALVWSDELPPTFVREFHLLRPVLRHRTSLILVERSEFEP